MSNIGDELLLGNDKVRGLERNDGVSGFLDGRSFDRLATKGADVEVSEGSALAPLSDLPDLTGAVLETIGLFLLAIVTVLAAEEIGRRLVRRYRSKRSLMPRSSAESAVSPQARATDAAPFVRRVSNDEPEP